MPKRVPVYLPDGAISAMATMDEDGRSVTLDFASGDNLANLFKESMVGLSVVYLRPEAREIMSGENNAENGTAET